MCTKHKNNNIERYFDSKWADFVDNKKSTIGYCVFLVGNLMVWRSKRQIEFIRSSVEVEYRFVAMIVTELFWLKILSKNMRINVRDRMEMYYDNKAATNLFNNPVLHDSGVICIRGSISYDTCHRVL